METRESDSLAQKTRGNWLVRQKDMTRYSTKAHTDSDTVLYVPVRLMNGQPWRLVGTFAPWSQPNSSFTHLFEISILDNDFLDQWWYSNFGTRKPSSYHHMNVSPSIWGLDWSGIQHFEKIEGNQTTQSSIKVLNDVSATSGGGDPLAMHHHIPKVLALSSSHFLHRWTN